MADRLRLPLFVFGTLRAARENHHYLAGHFDRMLPAELPGYRRIADLMIGLAEGASVAGELYFLKPAEYDATLAGCDELEEIPPGERCGPEYRRKRVTVTTAEGPVVAWAYVETATPTDAEGW